MKKEGAIWKKRGIILIIYFLKISMANADKIYLHDGSSISGEIVDSVPGISFTLRKEDGSIHVFKMNDVWKVKFEEDGLYQDKLYLKDGSIIIGDIIGSIPGETYKIKTKDRNVLVFKMDETEKVEFYQKVRQEYTSLPGEEVAPVQPSLLSLQEPKEKIKSEYKKLELSVFCGGMGGEASPAIGYVRETGEPIKAEIGGGFSMGVGLKVHLSPSWKLYSSFGYAEGEFVGFEASDDFNANFTRYPLKLGIVYETKSEEKSRFSFYFGPGIGIYLNPIFKSKIYYADLKNTVVWELNYKRALGLDGIAGVKWVNAPKRWFFYCEFQYSYVKYSLDKGVFATRGDDDEIVIPDSTWNELDGEGYGLFLGVGTYFPIK